MIQVDLYQKYNVNNAMLLKNLLLKLLKVCSTRLILYKIVWNILYQHILCNLMYIVKSVLKVN